MIIETGILGSLNKASFENIYASVYKRLDVRDVGPQESLIINWE